VQTWHEVGLSDDRRLREQRQQQKHALLEHAVERWEATRSLPWLVAALSTISVTHRNVPALLEAAAQVDHHSPGFPSVAFHMLRLMIQSGRKVEARQRLDLLLADGGEHFGPSARNRFLALRLRLARDLDDFLLYAPRLPIARLTVWGHGEQMTPVENPTPDYAEDALSVFHNALPLDRRTTVLLGTAVPDVPRRELVVTSWLQALLLGNRGCVQALAPVVSSVASEAAPYVTEYTQAKSEHSRRFAVALLLLKLPRLSPEQEWCPKTGENLARSRGAMTADESADLHPDDQPFVPEFLSDRERTAAQAELRELERVAPNYIGKAVLAWAKREPEDPRVPEILHLFVRHGYRLCADADTGKLSKAAFRLMHRRYPNSEWTKRTPYWYG
jgi:hypothetical protein